MCSVLKDKTCEGNLGQISKLLIGSMRFPFIGENLKNLSPLKTSNGGHFLQKTISKVSNLVLYSSALFHPY